MFRGFWVGGDRSAATIVVRTVDELLMLAEALRQEGLGTEPDQPIFKIETMEAVAAVGLVAGGSIAADKGFRIACETSMPNCLRRPVIN